MEPQQRISPDGMEEEMRQVKKAAVDSSAFEVLYNRYYRDILSFVYRRVETKDEAFDITQHVFIAALVNIQKYEYKGVPFSAWLYRIAINEMNRYFRQELATRALNIQSSEADELKQETDSSAEDDHLLYQNLARLEEYELQLIELRYFEKRPFKEIADILSSNENNIKVKTYRVIDKLKSMYKSAN